MMMHTKIYALLAAAGILSLPAMAQNEIDALRLSQSTPAGTALSLGMGGVGGSMGGDFNSLSINPAGIGVYRGGELSITPLIRFNSVNSEFDGQSTNQGSARFSIENFGLVMHSNLNKAGWKSVSFGIGMNTLANYNFKENAIGENFRSSVSDIMSADAITNGVSQQTVPPYGYLGYEGYLLDDDYNPIVPLSQGLIQKKLNEHRGSAKEFNLTVGGNYSERILLGLQLGIVNYNYDRITTYSEDDATNDPNNYFSYLDLTETLQTDGIGVNVKAGATFIPNRNVKLGVAFHTPTWAGFTDLMDYRLVSHTEQFKADVGAPSGDPVTEVMPEQPYSFDYRLRTPWKAILSATFLGSRGMISADYEYVATNSMRYSMNDFKDYEAFINENIESTFRGSHVLRLGGEAVLGSLFLRAGGAYHSSPYKMSDKYGGDRLDLSVGAGIRMRSFFIDLGYMHSRYNGSEFLYNASADGVYNPLLTSARGSNYVALTLGFKTKR